MGIFHGDLLVYGRVIDPPVGSVSNTGMFQEFSKWLVNGVITYIQMGYIRDITHLHPPLILTSNGTSKYSSMNLCTVHNGPILPVITPVHL